jgi:hypothetical protein
MSWREATAVVILAMILLGVVYDLVAYSVSGNEATISRLCLETADRCRGFAVGFVFLLGVLCGCLFVPQRVGP